MPSPPRRLSDLEREVLLNAAAREVAGSGIGAPFRLRAGLLGEMLAAPEAADYGLVNRVVAAGKAREEALAMARLIASKSSATVAIGKEAFYAQLEAPLAEAYAQAADVMVRNMMYQDAAEGIGAFIEKRPPTWKGC